VPSIINTMRLLADRSRLRLILLLEQEELSVAELQEILSMGQSRISTHLGQLKRGGLVEDRRSGKNILYRLRNRGEWATLFQLVRSGEEVPELEADARALRLILSKRQDRTRAYFDSLAGKFGREYVPGRSWKGLAEALLALMPPMTIADLGCGEGTFTLLLARGARHVIGVDNSPRMVDYANEVAARHAVPNIEFRAGDLEDPPIERESLDLAFFSQSLHHATHPDRAIQAAFHLLKPGGQIAVLDLKRHSFDQARELYADLHLGFAEAELLGLLTDAGFGGVTVAVVHREEESPYFETLLAAGRKAAAGGAT
jgi:ArsR family transcriptional regulator